MRKIEYTSDPDVAMQWMTEKAIRALKDDIAVALRQLRFAVQHAHRLRAWGKQNELDVLHELDVIHDRVAALEKRIAQTYPDVTHDD